ncbi:hypothetical protein [Campylobacter vicugnae]|uniref:hypothetical protein n=1 Tax=Campylobacter vicugnae TaxID=1660076 RepID=UPI000A3511F5|nr:hypothetical protein [Campylobacter sp. RM8835]
MKYLKILKTLLIPKDISNAMVFISKPYILGADGIKYSTKFYIVIQDAIYSRRGGKLITRLSR